MDKPMTPTILDTGACPQLWSRIIQVCICIYLSKNGSEEVCCFNLSVETLSTILSRISEYSDEIIINWLHFLHIIADVICISSWVVFLRIAVTLENCKAVGNNYFVEPICDKTQHGSNLAATLVNIVRNWYFWPMFTTMLLKRFSHLPFNWQICRHPAVHMFCFFPFLVMLLTSSVHKMYTCLILWYG